MVSERYNASLDAVQKFLAGELRVIAQETDGKYTISIVDYPTNGQGLQIIQRNDMMDKPITGGYWMDWWEPDHGVTKSQYNKMLDGERASLEAKLQLRKWTDSQFAYNFADFYHPEEYDKWFWDEGGADQRMFGLDKSNEYWKQRLKLGAESSGKGFWYINGKLYDVSSDWMEGGTNDHVGFLAIIDKETHPELQQFLGLTDSEVDALRRAYDEGAFSDEATKAVRKIYDSGAIRLRYFDFDDPIVGVQCSSPNRRVQEIIDALFATGIHTDPSTRVMLETADETLADDTTLENLMEGNVRAAGLTPLGLKVLGGDASPSGYGGLIDPSGFFFSCGLHQHNQLARMLIAKRPELYNIALGKDPVDLLIDNGWTFVAGYIIMVGEWMEPWKSSVIEFLSKDANQENTFEIFDHLNSGVKDPIVVGTPYELLNAKLETVASKHTDYLSELVLCG